MWISVYCGSSEGVKEEYAQRAEALGREIARRGHGLIYGGSSLGLMGVVSRAAWGSGGLVRGIIPAPLVPPGAGAVGYIEVVDTMHQRKARIVGMADMFIALPGGLGTMDELFETLTWFQLGIHRKPVGLLNVGGFFAPLQQLLTHQIEQGFIRPRYASLLVIEEDPALLLDRLDSHQMPEGEKFFSTE